MPSITGQAAKGREESCLPLLLGEGRMRPQPPRQHPTNGHVATQSSHLPCPVPITSPSPWWPRGARHRPVQPPVKGWELGRAKGTGVLPPPPSVSHSHAGGAIIPLQLGARLSTGKTPIPQALFRNVFPIVKNVETKSIQLCGFIFFPPPFMKLFVAVL